MKKKILIALLSIALVFTMMPLVQDVSYADAGDDIIVTGAEIPEDFALYVKGENGKTDFRTEDPGRSFTIGNYNGTGTVTYEWREFNIDRIAGRLLLFNKTGKFTLNKLGYNYGKHKVIVYAQDEKGEKDTMILTFWIDYDLNKANITVKDPVYNGKTGRVPTVAIKAKINGKQKTLKKGTDFTLKFKKSALKRKAVGTYSYMIKGKNYFFYSYDDDTDGDFDYYDRAFRILPRGTYIRYIKAGYKKLSVKWKKQSGKMPGTHIWGYQVQTATNKAFTKNKKTKTVKGYKKTSKTIRSLKSGKKYYIRVRTCKKVSGSMYYSKWSAVKTKRTR